MSSIIRSSKFAPRFYPIAAAMSSRTFTASSVRALKETNTDSPDLGNENEKHKQDQLKKQKDGKGHWKPELASESEEAVFADRSGKERNETFEELQKRTVQHADAKHKHGTSQDSGH